jgi:hypothetical protein
LGSVQVLRAASTFPVPLDINHAERVVFYVRFCSARASRFMLASLYAQPTCVSTSPPRRLLHVFGQVSAMAKPRVLSLPVQRRPHGLRFCARPCSMARSIFLYPAAAAASLSTPRSPVAARTSTSPSSSSTVFPDVPASSPRPRPRPVPTPVLIHIQFRQVNSNLVTC